MSIIDRIFKNNAITNLQAPAGSGATTLTVVSGAVFGAIPSGKHMMLTITEGTTVEVVMATAISGNNITVTRGQEGTVASAFTSSAKVSLRLTADSLNQILAYLATLPPPYADTYFGTLAALSYDSVSLGTLGAEFYSNGLVFSNSGLKLFVITNNGKIRKFSLSVAWNITTASFVSQVDWAAARPTDFHNSWSISEDGVLVTVAASSSGDTVIKQYTLSTPWDLSTATLTRTSAILLYAVVRLAFNHDGTKLMTYDNSNKNLRVYNLPTAYSVTGMTLGSSLVWASPLGNNHQNFLPNGDFSKVLWTSQTGGGFMMRNLTLSTPGDLTTATISEAITSPANIQWHDAICRGPSKLYVLANVADSEILQFSW